MSTELIERTDEILTEAEVPERHTFFQIEKFIIGKEPTHQGQLWQIVREIKARRDSVRSIMKDLAQAEDDLELFDLKIERANRQIRELAKTETGYTDLDIQELEIQIRRLQREKESLAESSRQVSKKLKYVMEEIAYLIAGYDRIVAEVGEMKPLDDEESQKELWNEKLLEQFNLRLLLKNPLDSEFVKTILSLDDDMPVKQHTVAVLQKVQKQLMIEKDKAEAALALPQAKVAPRVQVK